MVDQNDELKNELIDKDELAENVAGTEAEVETSDSFEEEIEDEEEDDGAEEVAAQLMKLKSEQVSLENFDWSRYNNKENVYSDDERNQLESMYDKTLSTIVENECVDGTVIAMNKREVVINIG
jgi:small subunit ribosomal protein S1